MRAVNILDELIIEPGPVYIRDRGHLDFARLFRIKEASAFFVARSKKNTQFRRPYSHAIDRSTGVVTDQTITPTGISSCKDYPEKIRYVVYRDPENENEKRLVFLTSNFVLAATTIAALYQSRWQIELFFKWIKQHLRIKAFFGTSENAVRSQI